jgi:hypothetical protein
MHRTGIDTQHKDPLGAAVRLDDSGEGLAEGVGGHGGYPFVDTLRGLDGACPNNGLTLNE